MNAWEVLALFSSFIIAAVLIRLTDFAEKNLDVTDWNHKQNPTRQGDPREVYNSRREIVKPPATGRVVG
jgi:hypothetical protein